MKDNGTLGILVNSNRHFDFVVKLSEAAASKGIGVMVHILGQGVAGINNADVLAALSRIAQVSVCAASMRQFARQTAVKMPKAVMISPPGQLARILSRCDRHVVF